MSLNLGKEFSQGQSTYFLALGEKGGDCAIFPILSQISLCCTVYCLALCSAMALESLGARGRFIQGHHGMRHSAAVARYLLIREGGINPRG